MLNREIPFRPRLEGDFRIRFYNAVSRITENTTLADIENIADEGSSSGTLSMLRGRRFIEMASFT